MNRYIVGLGLLLAACVPSVDACRVGAANTAGVIHLDRSILNDREAAEFVLAHEFFHVWTGSSSEAMADDFAEESVIYRGLSPCPAARILKACGLRDRAEALGVRNRCAGFGGVT